MLFQMTDGGFLNCVSCGEIVGARNERETYSLRLFKWSVALQRSIGLGWETCSVQEVVSAQLLALIEDQAVYKFLAYTGDAEDSKTALMVRESSRSLLTTCTRGLHPQAALGLYSRSNVLNFFKAYATRDENFLQHSHRSVQDN